MSILLGFFTVILVLASILMTLIILMQRPRGDSGLGAAIGGGGAAESAFGAQSETILTKVTIYFTVFFFVASFVLYLAYMNKHYKPVGAVQGLPEIHSLGDDLSGFGLEAETEAVADEAVEAPESLEVDASELSVPEAIQSIESAEPSANEGVEEVKD